MDLMKKFVMAACRPERTLFIRRKIIGYSAARTSHVPRFDLFYLTFLVIRRRGKVVSTPVSYLTDNGLKYRLGDFLAFLK